jgi:hypothetical protein
MEEVKAISLSALMYTSQMSSTFHQKTVASLCQVTQKLTVILNSSVWLGHVLCSAACLSHVHCTWHKPTLQMVCKDVSLERDKGTIYVFIFLSFRLLFYLSFSLWSCTAYNGLMFIFPEVIQLLCISLHTADNSMLYANIPSSCYRYYSTFLILKRMIRLIYRHDSVS